MSDLFDYKVSKLSKFTGNYNKINTFLGNEIKKLRNDNISNAKSILLMMLVEIDNSLYTFLQDYLNTYVYLATAYLKINILTRNSVCSSVLSILDDKIDWMIATVS